MTALRAAGPAPRTAVRASSCVLVALLVLWALGRVDLALYATFGAFTSVYGGPAHPRRWRTQVALGLVLTAAVATGALVGLSDERRWILVPVAAAWAALAAWWSDEHGWRPPGPLFPTFAVAACGSVPTTPVDLAAAVVTCAAVATLAVLVGALEVRHVPPHVLPVLPARPSHTRVRRLVQVARCAVVVVVAGSIATGSGIGHPYWAMVAAVVPFSAVGLRHQLTRSAHRAVGTLAGLGVAAVLLAWSPPVLAVIVVAALLQGLTELVVTRHYGVALLFITPLALVLGQLADPQPSGRLLLDRLLETLLGVAVGAVAAVLTRERADRTPDAEPRTA